MASNIISCVVAIVCVVILLPGTNAGRRRMPKSYRLDIIHFNDFHDRFEETSASSNVCVPSDVPCIGGFPRLYTKIMEMKREKPNALVLNAGDSFQGTLWFSIYRWNMTQYFINMLPIDAHTLGNHEFDNKLSGVVPYINALNSPVVIANMDDSLEPSIQGTYKKSYIVEKKNRKIGIIGVILQSTDTISRTEKLKFTDEVEAVRREAKKLSRQGANIIIVLSHSGIEVDRKIAKEGGNLIDIIVGGHSHSLLYNGVTPNGEVAVDRYPIVVEQVTGNKVLIVQASCFSKYLGNITVSFDSKGHILSWEGLPIYMENSIEQDPKILELMKPFAKETNEKGKVVIGYNNIFQNKTACDYGECNIGNLLMDSMIYGLDDHSGDLTRPTYNAAVISKGGIRTNIDVGNITYANIVEVQPFFDVIESFDIKGKFILDAFEFSVAQSTENQISRSSCLLQVSGFKIIFDLKNPPWQRVVSAKILTDMNSKTYTDIDPDEVYRIASTNFVANGGDGYSMFTENKMNSIVEGEFIEAFNTFIKKKSPLSYVVENRIVFL